MPASGGAEDNGNGKITVAILGERVERLTEAVKALTAEVKESNKCMNQLAVDGAMRETRLDAAESEIEKLRIVSNRNDIVSGISASIVGIFAAWMTGRQ